MTFPCCPKIILIPLFLFGDRTLDPMEERPMLNGEDFVRNNSSIISGSQIAFEPTKFCLLSAKSIKAISFSFSSTFTLIYGFLIKYLSFPFSKFTKKPAAIPAIVGSIINGKALFVPVEIGIKGV